MKKLFSALLVVFACALYAADTGLLSYAPAKSELLALADIEKILALPDVQKKLAEPDVVKELAALEEIGIKIGSFKTLMVFHWDDKNGGALRIADADGIRAQLDKSVTGEKGAAVAARDVNGRRIYRITHANDADKTLDMVFVADDVLFFCEVDDLDAYFAAEKMTAEKAAQIAVPDVEFWACWNNPEPPPAKQDPNNPDVRSVMATLNFAGEQKHDLDIRAVGVFGDDKAAAQIGMMVPGWMSLGAGMAFGDDPQTGEKLIKALKCDVEGSTVKVSLYLTEELVQRLVAAGEAAFKDSDQTEENGAKTAPTAPAEKAAPAPAEPTKRN
jgi:hypothetical protein